MITVLNEVNSTSKVNVTLEYTNGTYEQMKYWIERKVHGFQCSYRQQSEGDLGQKLTSAVKHSFQRGNEYVILIGNCNFYHLYTYILMS